MSSHLGCTCLFLAVAAHAGCAGSSAAGADAAVDARPIALGVGSTIAITSAHDLGPALPAGAQAMLDEIGTATADPMTFVLARMIAELPAGTVQNVASDVEPIVAAYLDDKLDSVAPRFVAGMRAIAQSTAVIAQEFGTLETLQIETATSGFRRITGLRFAVAPAPTPIDVSLAAHGLADIVVGVGLELSASDQLTIGQHVVPLPYGTLLRLGVDAAVIPVADPGQTDLDGVLRDLVDCTALGALVADKVGVGSPSLYEAACDTGMTAAANELYGKLTALDAAPLELSVVGTAVGDDRNGDSMVDTLLAGVWSGTASYAGVNGELAASTFSGRATP